MGGGGGASLMLVSNRNIAAASAERLREGRRLRTMGAEGERSDPAEAGEEGLFLISHM